VSRSGAARKHRTGAISAMLVYLKSAELLYEPSVLTRARSNNRCGFERSASAPVGRCATPGAGGTPSPSIAFEHTGNLSQCHPGKSGQHRHCKSSRSSVNHFT
jgi:hypothetical protein